MSALLKSFLLTSLVAVAAQGEEATDLRTLTSKPPTSLEELYLDTIEKIGDQAWFAYQTKLLQIIETYHYETDPESNYIEYISTEENVCKYYEDSGPVYKIFHVKEKTDTESNYQIMHWGCGGFRVYEQLLIEGDGQYKLTPVGIFTGLRPYAAPEGQSKLQYTLYNQHKQELIQIYEENLGYRRNFVVFIGGQLVFEIIYEKDEELILFNGQGFDVEWDFGRSGEWRTSYEREPSGMVGYMGELKSVQFLGANSGLDRSLNEFRGFLNWIVFEPISSAISNQLSLIADLVLPEANFSRAGSANDELLEQLDLIVALIQAGDRQTAINEINDIRRKVEQNKIREF